MCRSMDDIVAEHLSTSLDPRSATLEDLKRTGLALVEPRDPHARQIPRYSVRRSMIEGRGQSCSCAAGTYSDRATLSSFS
jgi:hypothetical protein